MVSLRCPSFPLETPVKALKTLPQPRAWCSRCGPQRVRPLQSRELGVQPPDLSAASASGSSPSHLYKCRPGTGRPFGIVTWRRRARADMGWKASREPSAASMRGMRQRAEKGAGPSPPLRCSRCSRRTCGRCRVTMPSRMHGTRSHVCTCHHFFL